MADPDSTSPNDEQETHAGESVSAPEETGETAQSSEEELDTEALRQQVEEKYDFDNFGPADMEKMTAEEWEAVFDEDTWITGPELLDRVAQDLRHRVSTRDVFARIERHENPPRVLAYSDEGYAIVYPDGSVEGEGTVLRDVKPTVALASMDSYDVPENVPDNPLPEPEAVPEGGGELGNRLLQVIASIQLLAGLGLFGAGILALAGIIGTPNQVGLLEYIVPLIVGGLAFIGIALLLFFTVANARLSDTFRAEEYRDRLRAIGLEDGERPDFVPELEPQNTGDHDETREAGGGGL